MFYKSKTNVSVLQLGLKRAGLYDGEIDGIYGPDTERAVNELLRINSIETEDDKNEEALKLLLSYLGGYIVYEIQAGDTYYDIARRYNTSVRAIETANPGVSYNNLVTGQKITVPITESVTVTDLDYNSYLVGAIAEGIKKRYPFIELVYLGKSVWGNMIYLIKVGVGEKEIFINAEHHANEWITTPLVFKFTEDFLKAYTEGGEISGFSAREIYNNITLFSVACVNPDGIDIVNDAVDGERYESVKRISEDYENIPFPSGWKANANGVDLNLNYPAGWERAREIKFSQGFTSPAPRDFVGSAPLSQPESIAMYDLTVRNLFMLTISYHTQGEVIYWKYQDFEPENSFEIGKILSDVSGYELSLTPPLSSYAGYKDWFIQTYNKPGYTVEAGLGNNPLPISEFDEIYEKNLPLMANALKIVSDM